MYKFKRSLDEAEKAEVEAAIGQVIRTSIGEAVKNVTFAWSDIREDEAKVEITIEIEVTADPLQWRGKFAGLTSRVKGAMGEALDGVFPVLMARAA